MDCWDIVDILLKIRQVLAFVRDPISFSALLKRNFRSYEFMQIEWLIDSDTLVDNDEECEKNTRCKNKRVRGEGDRGKKLRERERNMHNTQSMVTRERDALASVSIMQTRWYTLNLQKEPWDRCGVVDGWANHRIDLTQPLMVFTRPRC